MDDQNKSDAENNAIERQIPAPSPITIIEKPTQTRIVSNIFTPKTWKWIKISTIVIGIITFISTCTSIPNNITQTIINYKILFPVNNPMGSWKPPELPENCQDLTLIWGGCFYGDYVAKAKNTNVPISIQGASPFSIRVNNNRLYIDCDFFTDEYGLLKIRGDSVSPQLPQTWDMNSSSNALEIVNGAGVPIFQLFYRRPDEIVINGVFKLGGMVWFASNEKLEYFGTNNIDFKIASQTNFKELTDRTHPIFKYPSWNHRGQMVENPN